jgi:hypothetical protein
MLLKESAYVIRLERAVSEWHFPPFDAVPLAVDHWSISQRIGEDLQNRAITLYVYDRGLLPDDVSRLSEISAQSLSWRSNQEAYGCDSQEAEQWFDNLGYQSPQYCNFHKGDQENICH